MNNAINLTPEAVEALNNLCDAGNVDSIIVKLGNAEESLQKVAYEDMTGQLDYLFRFAYDLKTIRMTFENLEKIFGYEPERD
ncbi:MAG: hypothetical protein IJK45_01360 [Bacteroidaceae bacterium]|nr:hypothetical protein [Bacteroidaceae bacterium]